MLDLKKLNYGLQLVTEDGTRYDLLPACDSLGWEEGKGELALRISITLRNADAGGVLLEERAKPGCILLVLADWGEGEVEVARGSIQDWKPDDSPDRMSLSLTAYDELFPIAKSQDNRYVPAGTGTKTAILTIFQDWGIPVGEYRGPDIPNPKTAYRGNEVADILQDLLDTAKKQGAGEHFLRAHSGKVDVLPAGSNETVWYLAEADGNIEGVGYSVSVGDLVTRVKVMGAEDKAGRQPVEAVLDGRTEFGIRQRLVSRSKNDSLATAKAEAQSILDEEGKPVEDIQIDGPDIPTLRKWDKINLSTRRLKGDFLVTSIRHSAGDKRMSLTVKPMAATAQSGAEAEAQTAAPAPFQKGDVVVLSGAIYNDSYGGGKGKTLTGYRGTITLQVDRSRPCPYHMGTIGWVRPETLTKA